MGVVTSTQAGEVLDRVARRKARTLCALAAAFGLLAVALFSRAVGDATFVLSPRGEEVLDFVVPAGPTALVLGLLAGRFGRPVGLVGFSLGGNVTLKLLGERGAAAHALVAAAVAVSVPFDLAAGSDRIGSGVMGRVYTRYFMRSLLRKVALKEDLLRDACDIDAVRRARTLRQFDDVATAPLHGFAGAADYYERSSSAAFIDGIRVPALVIHSMDDPFLPPDRVPAAALEANPHVTPVLTARGGHVGFIEGSVLRPRFWVEEAIAGWLAGRLGPGRRPDGVA